MYTEEDLLPLSALQHLLYCPRQCALIHVERLWTENRYTAEGRIMHERVHTTGHESRKTLRVEYGVLLRSLELGISGQADVVEFHLIENGETAGRKWRPFPVEYKRGRAKKEGWDRVQLCAQGLCLEEMLDVPVSGGALFYGKRRRRLDVDFDAALRSETKETAKRLHELIASGKTPEAAYSGKCDRCSFLDSCLPKALGKAQPINRYLSRMLGE
jgi:CRISPR-associated exonuclease Cas4